MGGRDPLRPDEFETVVDGAAAVRAVSDSAPSSHPPPSQAPEPMTIEIGPDSPTLLAPAPRTGAPPAPSGFAGGFESQVLLAPGAVLGQRYEIVQVLGRGGMGAVYKARDREVDRIVALKVIRPDLAGNASILERFKQELVLSHQVTHKNVVRIYDLGDAEGMKFITMEYIEGSDLRSLILERKSFPPAEAVDIMLQVCRALEAAHAVGVIHRDLKPQNIMRDKQGRIVLMDFGLARLIESNGMTQTGALVGTMEYMSPEQALGSALDQRSDLFTVGLIFYELLTGRMPFAADSALASLIKRTQERAAPVSHHDKSIPAPLERIVAKCMERDPKLRYQSAGEIIGDLDVFLGKAPVSTVSTVFPAPAANKKKYLYAGAGAFVLVLCAVAAVLYFRAKPTTSGGHAPVTLLVSDFENKTSDGVFDGTLEPAFTLALEGASFIDSFSRAQAHSVAAQLKPGTTALDESLARLVAVRQGISVVLTGSVSTAGTGYQVEAKAIDAVTGKTIATAETDASNKQDVLQAVAKLAAHIRTALGDTTPESVQLAKTETYSSSSLEAAHEYALAQDLHDAGKFQESLAHYSKAIQLDPNMGRAYAGMAASESNMGHNQDALKDYQLAMARIDRMTDREKYRTRGGYYLLEHEPKKAIDEFNTLVKQFPFDDAGYTNLAIAYGFLHEMPKALEEAEHAVEISPKEVLGRINVGVAAIYAGDSDTGIKSAQAIQQADPNNPYVYRILAMADVGESKFDDAMENYRKLASMGPDSASLAALGTADIALYQGKAEDAITILNKGISDDLARKDNASAATKLVALAFANVLGGHDAQAIAAADRAISLDNETNIEFAAGRMYVEAGQPAKAMSIAAKLSNSIESDPQLYGKLLEGEARLKRGDAKAAVQLFQAAQNSVDTWMGHFDLGRAYLDVGMFTEADSEFETCLKRQGEAAALFFDELPTFRLLPPVYYYLGRAQEGLKSPAAKDSYRKMIALQEQGTGPLLADARKRLATP